MTFCASGVTFIHRDKAEGKTNDVVEKSLNNILLKIFNFSHFLIRVPDTLLDICLRTADFVKMQISAVPKYLYPPPNAMLNNHQTTNMSSHNTSYIPSLFLV